MGCCFCCLNEGEQVKLIMQKFEPVPLSRVEPGPHPQLICARVQPADRMVFAPISGRPCVRYECKVEELVHTDDSSHWEHRFTETMSTNFFLTDPSIPDASIYVPGQTTPIRDHSIEDGAMMSGMGAASVFQHENIPPGVKDMLARHGMQIEREFMGIVSKREMRYAESKVELNEQIAILGVVTEGLDWNGRPVKQLQPVRYEHLNESYFEKNGWSDWDKKAWEALTRSPALILTDDNRFFKGVNIAASNFSLPPGYSVPSNNNPMPSAYSPAGAYATAQGQQLMQQTAFAPAPGQQMVQPMASAPFPGQPMMQPMAFASPPGQQLVQVTVPPGLPPGGIFNIMTPDGRMVAVQVPPGLAPGTLVQMRV
jgi:hypothetical protein